MKKNTTILLAFFCLLSINCFSEEISFSEKGLVSSGYVEFENMTTSPVHLSLKPVNISNGALVNVSVINELDKEINLIERSRWVFSGKEPVEISSGEKKSFIVFTENSELKTEMHRIKIARVNVSKKNISENEEHSIPVGEIEAYMNFCQEKNPIITLTKVTEFESYIKFEDSYIDENCVRFTIS